MLVLKFYVLFQFLVLFVSGHDHVKSSVFVFGDSNFETGRKSSEHSSWMKADYFPYASKCMFLGTNRFTDGLTIPEIIANSLNTVMVSIDGIQQFPWDEANFASASAGILPETGTAFGKNLWLKDQIRVFKEYAQRDLKESYNTTELSNYLLNSIYLIYIGSSDYIYNYLQPDFYNTSNRYNDEEFAEHLIEEYGNYIKDLYKFGARNMVIFQIGPLGCLPYMIKKFKPSSRCVEKINNLVSMFNEKLEVKLNELRNELRDSKFVTARVFPLIKNMIENPSHYGFQETRLPCCLIQKSGTGLCEESVFRVDNSHKLEIPRPNINEHHSQSQNVHGCREFPYSYVPGVNGNTEKSVFFDELHMTEAANVVIVKRCLSGTDGVCSPYGIYTLAEGLNIGQILS